METIRKELAQTIVYCEKLQNVLNEVGLKIINDGFELIKQKDIHLELVNLNKKVNNTRIMVCKAILKASFNEEKDKQKRIIPLLMTKYEEYLSSVYEVSEKMVQINEMNEDLYLNMCSTSLKQRNNLKTLSELAECM